ncbi:MAG: NAD-dependent epimerase/dehydratase family protein [Deltaproteobacteria bacterium]|nr:NAD-dependent epimerase/dehydratase family protein [Deltaproteobacteria bacterium]
MATLITGGTGFIGAEVARILAERGERPIVLDISDRKTLLRGVEDRVTIVKGDVSNYSHVFNVIKQYGIDVIYHLGSMLSIPSDADPWSAFRVNAQGSFHVLEAARILSTKKVIFSSTLGTYGLDIREGVIDDYSLQRPTLFYGCTKVFVELMGRFYKRKFGLDFRGVRYPAVVGPGVKTPGIVQYYPWAIEHAYRGKPFKIWVTPDTRCAAMYYKDAALSIIQCAEAPLERIKMGVYVLAGMYLSAQELVDNIKKFIPDARLEFEPDMEKVEIIKGLSKPIDERYARDEFGWVSRYPIERTIEDFIKELRENPEKYA